MQVLSECNVTAQEGLQALEHLMKPTQPMCLASNIQHNTKKTENMEMTKCVAVNMAGWGEKKRLTWKGRDSLWFIL